MRLRSVVVVAGREGGVSGPSGAWAVGFLGKRQPAGVVDLLEGRGDTGVVGIQGLGHHHEVRRLLRITLGEGLSCLDQKLADLVLDLERLVDLALSSRASCGRGDR